MVRMNFIFIFISSSDINGPNEFYFQFNQPGCSRKDKRKNIIELQYCTGHESEGNKKIKLKKNIFYFFSNFQKIG